jgi:hypothetical protein
MSQQSLSDFRKLFKTLAVFVCLMPLGGWLARHKIIDVFPPLGGEAANQLALTVATVLFGIAGVLPWRMDIKRRTKILMTGVAFGIALASAILYFYLCQEYVLSVPLPNGSTITVSVGSVRSQLAQETLPSSSTDIRLLEEQPNEEGVHKLWTEQSILSVRLRLFLTYVGWLLPINFILGLYARPGQKKSKAKAGSPLVDLESK